MELWQRTSSSTLRLGRKTPCGPPTSTGSGLVGPSLAATRALWLTYTGGNIREWSLWTATATRRQPKRLRFVARDVELPAPIILGEGDRDTLPYSVGTRVVALDSRTGTPRFSTSLSERVVALATQRGRVAAALANGGIVILDRRGAELGTTCGTSTRQVDAVRFALAGGSTLWVQRGRTLELCGAGGAVRRGTLPPGARLVDAEGNAAVYVRRNQVHGVVTEDVVLRRTAGPAFAQLEPVGLIYASGRRVATMPMAAVERRLR